MLLLSLPVRQQAPTERGQGGSLRGALVTARRPLRIVGSLTDSSRRDGVLVAPQRAALAAVAMALSAVLHHASPAAAMEPAAGALPQMEVAAAEEAVTPVYFGNGCFWGRYV